MCHSVRFLSRDILNTLGLGLIASKHLVTETERPNPKFLGHKFLTFEKKNEKTKTKTK